MNPFLSSNLDASDVAHPWLNITQSNSRLVEANKVEKGKIINSITHEVYDAIKLVFLGVKKQFKVWSADGKLEYHSPDMKTLYKNTNSEWVEVGSLAESDLWKNRLGNKNAKTSYVFLAAHVNNSNNPSFVRLDTAGLAYKQAKRFINKASNRKENLMVTELATEEVATDHGIKFIPTFRITDEEVPEILLKAVRGGEISKIAENFCNQTPALAAPENTQLDSDSHSVHVQENLPQ